MKVLFLSFTILIGQISVFAQQCADPDASIWEKAWYTCAQSQSPNLEYGPSYWIQYDFGRVRTLSKSWIWNVNDPAHLSRGFQSVQIDYSVDGSDWVSYGQMDFPMGTGEAIYGGFPGPDLTGVEAQYILLTALSNHGDAGCFGLTEVKFNLLPNVEGDKVDQDHWCVSGFSEIAVEDVGLEDAYIIWDYPTDDERFQDYFFPVQYRPEGDEVWKGKLAEDLFVFLEELEPGTTYEFRLGTACTEFISYTDIYTFTTEGEAIDCTPVELVDITELTADGALVSWEAVAATDGYLVAYQELDTEDWQTFYTEVPYIELSNLQPETEYELYVAVYCDEEELWNEETPLLFTTIEKAIDCTPVELVDITELTADGALVSWEAVAATDGYLVAYQELDTEDWQTFYTEVPYIELSGLLPGTAYELHIAVYCDEEELWNEETPLLFTTIESEGPLVSIPERLPLQNYVNIYPNPGIGRYVIDLTQSTYDAIQYRVTDMLGRQYLADRIWEKEVSVQLDLRHLSDGIYFLTLDAQEQPAVTFRLVKISKW